MEIVYGISLGYLMLDFRVKQCPFLCGKPTNVSDLVMFIV